MSDWQPIDTAPKDGTHVLLVWPTSGPLVGYWFGGDGARGECAPPGWRGAEYHSRLVPPTHWLPLPERP